LRASTQDGASLVVEPPTKNNGARRVWSDSRGRIWVSEWVSGNLSLHDPAAKTWRTWKVPGDKPHNYAVWVDERDIVWMAEWTGNAVYSFDPQLKNSSALDSRARHEHSPDPRPQGRGVAAGERHGTHLGHPPRRALDHDHAAPG